MYEKESANYQNAFAETTLSDEKLNKRRTRTKDGPELRGMQRDQTQNCAKLKRNGKGASAHTVGNLLLV